LRILMVTGGVVKSHRMKAEIFVVHFLDTICSINVDTFYDFSSVCWNLSISFI